MARTPAISVMLAFYDDGSAEARDSLSEALRSVLGQTFRDFEIVLVVSGEREFARKQAMRSKKIRLFFFNQEKRDYRKIPLKEKIRGIVTAWNLCVKNSRGRLLAFHSYDDISLPNRLEAQASFLERHPEIGAVGSAMTMIDTMGREMGIRRVLETDEQIRSHMLQFNPVPSPTVMARASVLRKAGGFCTEGIPEDYDLWVRMAAITKFHNLRQPLVKYRIHGRGGVSIYRLPLYLGSLRVKRKAARLLGLKVGAKDIAVNMLQFISLFFPNRVRRIALERLRGKFVVGQ